MELQPEQGEILLTTGDGAQCQGTSPELCQLPRGAGEAGRGEDIPAVGQESQEAGGQGQAPQPGEEDALGPSNKKAPEEQQESEDSKAQDSQEGPPAPGESDASPGGASRPAGEPPSARPPAREREPEPDFYCVKWITWKGERTPIITQSENGPCPLLAIMNILFLQWKVSRMVGTGSRGSGHWVPFLPAVLGGKFRVMWGASWRLQNNTLRKERRVEVSYPSCLFCFDLCCRVGGLGQWVAALALTGEVQGKASLSSSACR